MRLCLTFGALFWLAAQPQVLHRSSPEPKREPDLEAAIRTELGTASFSYAYNRVNMSDGAAPGALVYLPGRDYCGSGGCTLLVFTRSREGYRLVTRVSLARVPVMLSSHRTNGWRDLILFVSGGGIQPGYYAVLHFDGKTYPENPTVEPAAPLLEPIKADAYLVGADKGKSVIFVTP